MPNPTDYQYTAAMLLTDGSEVEVDLEVRGWADPARLAQTVRFSLLPKEGVILPVVIVNIPDGAKPVFKTRVFGTVNLSGAGQREYFRCHGVGWKKGSTEHITWVLPTGDIEVGPYPHMADTILAKMREDG